MKGAIVSPFCLFKSLNILAGFLQSRVLIFFNHPQSGLAIAALEFFENKLETRLAPHAASCINEEQEHWCRAPSVLLPAAVIPVKDAGVWSHRTFLLLEEGFKRLSRTEKPSAAGISHKDDTVSPPTTGDVRGGAPRKRRLACFQLCQTAAVVSTATVTARHPPTQ